MRISNRQLISACLMAGSVLIALSACSEREESSAAGTAPPGSTLGGMTQGAAIYGVNVDVSYGGAGARPGDGSMVYVFLRQPGSRMPLAVQHFAGTELPKTVSFAGSSREEGVELVVRLSPSGRVDRSPEDVEVVRMLPGLLHPPQTLAVVLGGEEGEPVAADTGPAHTVSSAAPVTAAVVPVAIRTSIRIDEGSPFGPESVVFVIAKRPGQAMPSAVKRLSLGELPAEIELSDADAMSFGNRLSDAASLEVYARVSQSGTASRSESDWVSETVRVETSAIPADVPLTIHAPAG